MTLVSISTLMPTGLHKYFFTVELKIGEWTIIDSYIVEASDPQKPYI